MRFLFRFFTGVLILALTFAAIWAASGIFDTGLKLKVEPYFFQPNDLSLRRVGVPVTPEELGLDKMRQLLVDKYIQEYFYVIPDEADVTARMKSGSVLAILSTADVFKEWQNGEGEEIQRLAGEKALRLVGVTNMFKPTDDSEYWTIEYELKTWQAPNDFSQGLQITRGVLYMAIREEMGFRQTADGNSLDIAKYLTDGREPAGIFRFQVTAIGVPETMKK